MPKARRSNDPEARWQACRRRGRKDHFLCRETEPTHICHNAPHEFLPLGVRHDPIEEIALNSAVDSSGAERFARQKPFRIVLTQLHNGQRDALGDVYKKSVLEPQRIALDLAAIHELEQFGPELTLERDGTIAFQLQPQGAQSRIDEMEGNRVVAELALNCQRVWRQRNFQRQRAVKPGEKNTRLFRIEDYLLDLNELAARELKNRPLPTIGSYADKMLTLSALSVSEIIRHPPLNIVPFSVEITLGLENRAPDQSVNATLNLGNSPFEIQVG